jgi:hypothetical protein
MFDSQGKEPTDYTGLKIGALLIPVFVLLVFFGNADHGLAVCIVLGVTIVAIKLRWNLRKHVWFWVTILFVFALHVPLVRMVRWPQGSTPTLFYTMPLGIVEFLIVLGAIDVAERMFSRHAHIDR